MIRTFQEHELGSNLVKLLPGSQSPRYPQLKHTWPDQISANFRGVQNFFPP